MKHELIIEERITKAIYLIRNQKVMMDSDLAILYGVKTKVLLHVPDLPEGQAGPWMDLDKTRIGCEINFTKLQRGDKYLLYNFKKPMREEGILVYTIPEMPNHPDQAYTAKTIV